MEDKSTAKKVTPKKVDESTVEETVAPVEKGPIQGNTDPKVFDVFDEKGVFIEKRDR